MLPTRRLLLAIDWDVTRGSDCQPRLGLTEGLTRYGKVSCGCRLRQVSISKPRSARLKFERVISSATVMLGVTSKFLGVMLGMRSMAVRHHRVMSGFFDRSRFVVLHVLDGAARPLHDAQQHSYDAPQFSMQQKTLPSFPSHAVQM